MTFIYVYRALRSIGSHSLLFLSLSRVSSSSIFFFRADIIFARPTCRFPLPYLRRGCRGFRVAHIRLGRISFSSTRAIGFTLSTGSIEKGSRSSVRDEKFDFN